MQLQILQKGFWSELVNAMYNALNYYLFNYRGVGLFAYNYLKFSNDGRIGMLNFEISEGTLRGHSNWGISMIKENFAGYVAFSLYSVLLYLRNASSEMG